MAFQMVKYLLSSGLILSCVSQSLSAQNSRIEPDRPDQTESPSIVSKNYIQIENGLMMEKENAMSKNYSHPTILWKYGLNGRFELRIITEFVSQKQDNTVTTGLNPIVMGIKVKLAEEKGIIPATAFLGHLTSATLGSKPFHTTYIAPSFRFTMQHTLSDNLSLGYNLGSEWDGESAEPTYIYTLTCGLSVTKQLSGFIEVYGFAPQDDKADHRFDCGVTYLLNDDLVVDLSGGIGLTKNAPDHFISCGFSYRFKATK